MDIKKDWCFSDTLEPLFYHIHADKKVSWAYIAEMKEIIMMDEETADLLVTQGKVVEESENIPELIIGSLSKALGNDPSETFTLVGEKSKEPKEPEVEPNVNVIKIPETYRAELCNTSISPEVLIRKLNIAIKKEDKPNCISILFEGAPGTGKTMAAAHIAAGMGKSLVSYRISDLQNKYIGESEKAITKAFDDAEKKGYVLHMDEIDSISRSRGDDSKGYEIKSVNTLLQCLDRFKGVFIATTNYKDDLDAAIKRRFLLKQEFKNCTTEQADALSLLFFKRKAPKGLPNGVFAPADFKIVKDSFLFEENSTITRKFILERLTSEAKDRNNKDLINIKKAGFAHE